MVSCTFVLIALVFWIFNSYMTRTSVLNFKKWDVNNITAADFTAEYTITNDIWQEYKNVANAAQPTDRAFVQNDYCLRKFSDYLNLEIEKRIACVPWVVKQDERNLGVAKISFAFNNEDLLYALDTRGTYIKNGQLDKLKQVNAKLKKLYDEDKEKLITPVRAYVTFQS